MSISVKGGILAAGLGERLRDASELKPLARIAGRPLIAHVLDSFDEAGASDVTIIINESSERVREEIAAVAWPFRLHWLVETTPSSMHSFVRLLEQLARDGDAGSFLIATVDTILPPGKMRRFHELARSLTQADLVLAVNEPAPDDNPLWVECDPVGRVIAIGDSAKNTRIATAGVYVASPLILRESNAAMCNGLTSLRGFLGWLLGRQYRIFGISIGNSVDVDRAADIIAAENLLRNVS